MLIMMMKMTKNLLQITYSVKRIMTHAFFGLNVSNGGRPSENPFIQNFAQTSNF